MQSILNILRHNLIPKQTWEKCIYKIPDYLTIILMESLTSLTHSATVKITRLCPILISAKVQKHLKKMAPFVSQSANIWHRGEHLCPDLLDWLHLCGLPLKLWIIWQITRGWSLLGKHGAISQFCSMICKWLLCACVFHYCCFQET